MRNIGLKIAGVLSLLCGVTGMPVGIINSVQHAPTVRQAWCNGILLKVGYCHEYVRNWTAPWSTALAVSITGGIVLIVAGLIMTGRAWKWSLD